ncbi:MAG: transcriptional regulator, TraR/DksA family [Thermoleophilia bacterium]|nr:transcriptional regulator, TraR/DksA family [Thermoleophilia bacterium]
MALTKQQTSELQKQLRSERKRILFNIEALHTEFGTSQGEESDENGLETHLGDQGTMTFLRERDLSIEEHEEQLLNEIDAALQRIKDGTYGTCEVDGTPIDFERLQALPWARTHVEHATST